MEGWRPAPAPAGLAFIFHSDMLLLLQQDRRTRKMGPKCASLSLNDWVHGGVNSAHVQCN